MTDDQSAGPVAVMLATYNEASNVRPIYDQIRAYLPDAAVLFVDDNSPDGTGAVIDGLCRTDSRIHVIHRPRKLGIGSAHREGMAWAYSQGIRYLVTMDSDMAHSPDYIGQFLAAARDADVVVGTRFSERRSLQGWSIGRKILTHAGHWLTHWLLAIPYDATGAFRCYDLQRVPRAFLDCVASNSYSFFFESMHVLCVNGYRIREIPIQLPARTYGTSKMRWRDAISSLLHLFRQVVKSWIGKSRLRIAGSAPNTPERWNAYWFDGAERPSVASRIYRAIAAFYRAFIIRPSLNRALARAFAPGETLLHAGSGAGAVDDDAVARYRIIACDFSERALQRYGADAARRNAALVRADIGAFPFASGSVGGVYNLGVMEHFNDEEIDAALQEFRRVLRSDGQIVLFWPPEFGFSVMVLKAVHFLMNDVMGRNEHLHPAEVNRIRSRAHAHALFTRNGFTLDNFGFGPSDLFTHAILVGRPTPDRGPLRVSAYVVNNRASLAAARAGHVDRDGSRSFVSSDSKS